MILLFSCEKEHQEAIIKNVSPIAGTWDFISIDAQTQSITGLTTYPEKGKSLNYVTENNAGKLIITDSTITTIGLSYTISSNLKNYRYNDYGVLVDSKERPYTLSFYDPQSVCTYKLIGDDSVYFPQGGFINIPTSTLKTDQLEAKISFKGDTLLFKEDIYRDSTWTRWVGRNWGYPAHTLQTGTAIVRAVKHR